MILTMAGGGAERQLAFLAAELAHRGHDVHLAFVHTGVNSDRLDGSRCTLHPLATSGKFDPRLLVRSLSLLRRLRPDVVQTWLVHMDIIGGASARLLDVPWVLCERSAGLSYPPTLLNRIRVMAGRRADVIVPNSPGGAEYWTGQGVDPARIDVVPNYVPATEIESADRLDDARLADDAELVLYIGRLSAEKNLSVLIEAMQQVCRARPRAILALCGEGPLLAGLTGQVRAAGIENRVVFAGFVNNIASWLKRSSVVVAISPCEGHPNAVLEAMAAGVPVVVSDIPAHRSILDDRSASFVSQDDPKMIAGGIVGTLGVPQAAMQRAAAARKRLAPQSLEAMAMRYEDVYQRAVAIRGRA